MARIDPKDMLLFAKVAELRSISAAARLLARPKATVSRAVVRLEDALEARLLERSSRHLVVTEAGRVFLRHCQHVVDELEAAETAVGVLQVGVRGRLRVAVPMTFGRAVLAPVLGQFLLDYPELRLELRLTDRMFDPIEDGFDVVVRPGPLADSSMMAREIGSTGYGVYASADYLKRHAPILRPEDIAAHPVLDYFAGAESMVWSFTRDGLQTDVQVRPHLDVNDAVMRRDASIRGVGVALLPTWICEAALRNGSLQPVVDAWAPKRTVQVYAVWPSRRNTSPALRAFLDFLTHTVTLGSAFDG